MRCVSLAGLRSDRYAAGVEFFCAVSIGLLAQFDLRRAIGSAGYYLEAEAEFLAPKWWLIVAPLATAVLHSVPAILLAIAALFVKRSDPFARPLLAAATTIALGSANTVSVMGIFFGAPLLLAGVLAALLALRPNNPTAATLAALTAVLLGYAACGLNFALYPSLLAESRGRHEAIDAVAMLSAVAAGAVAFGLTAWRLRLRGSLPQVAHRRRVLLVVSFFLPASAVVYWLLVKLGLPLSS